MSEIDILALIPMGILFVIAFAVMPIVNTVREEGDDGVDRQQIAAFGVISLGAVSLWVLSRLVGRSRFTVWPLLLVMTGGFLWYLKLMRDRGELHEEPEMGGTSYE